MAKKRAKAKKPNKRRGSKKKIRPSAARVRKAQSRRHDLQTVGADTVAVLRELGHTAHYRTFLYQGGVRASLEVALAPTGDPQDDLIALEGAMLRPVQSMLEQLDRYVGDPDGPDYQGALTVLRRVAGTLSGQQRRTVLAAGKAATRAKLRAALRGLAIEEPVPEDGWLMAGARVDIHTADGELTDSPTIDRGGDTLWSHASQNHPGAFVSASHAVGNSLVKLESMGAMVAMSDIVARVVWTYDGSAPATPRR